MQRSKLSHESTASGPTRMRWSLRSLPANDILKSLPDPVKRVIARRMSVTEAAALLPREWPASADTCRRNGWSRDQLMRRIGRGEIEALKIYGRWVVAVASVERALGA